MTRFTFAYPRMRLVLGGGGDREQMLPLHAQFASWLNSRDRILYWPVALRDAGLPYAVCYNWLRGLLAPLVSAEITLWDDLTRHQPQEIAEFSALYIGSGDPLALHEQIEAAGFADAIRAFAEAGQPIFGNEAGAVVLGRQVAVLNRPNPPSPADAAPGVDLVAGHTVWSPYAPIDHPAVERFAAAADHPLLAIGDDAGLVVANGSWRVTGKQPIMRFDGRQAERLVPALFL